MTINKAIVSALSTLGLPVTDGLYQGEKTEYIYFVVADDRGVDFGDGLALADEYSVQIHYVCPWSMPYTVKRSQIRHLLEGFGFTYAHIVDLSDSANKIRHLCFECEISSDEFEEEV